MDDDVITVIRLVIPEVFSLSLFVNNEWIKHLGAQ